MTGDDRISISMTINEWNAIIAMLAKQPYEIAAPFIQQITFQAQQAAGSPNPPASTIIEPIRTASPMNGQDVAIE
jgi:hypothetical protein